MISYQTLIMQLASVPHFRGMPESSLSEIILAGQVQRYPAGCVIFTQDEPSAGMFVLITGQIHLCKLGPQGQQNIMAVINPVIMFNEVSVLDGGPNPATAIALQESVAWQIGAAAFQTLLQKYPQMGLGLLRVLAARNRLLIAHYEDLSFRSVLGRCAKLLLDLSRYGALPIDRREHSIQEMAGRIATAPEVISRSLNSFKSSGMIITTRAVIEVRQPARLAELAQVGDNFLRDNVPI